LVKYPSKKIEPQLFKLFLFSRMSLKVFHYSPEDLGKGENNFDEIWATEWQRVQDQGLLRYNEGQHKIKKNHDDI
jgi:hypothetical protein